MLQPLYLQAMAGGREGQPKTTVSGGQHLRVPQGVRHESRGTRKLRATLQDGFFADLVVSQSERVQSKQMVTQAGVRELWLPQPNPRVRHGLHGCVTSEAQKPLGRCDLHSAFW